jgi:hypothetical protein
VILTLVVPDPPPTREHPGRAADRDSPNAQALISAADALIKANPGVFPLAFSRIDVVFGKTLPDVDPLGYQPDHPIYEVLHLVIEPEGWSNRNEQDPSVDFYVVTFTLEDVP